MGSLSKSASLLEQLPITPDEVEGRETEDHRLSRNHLLVKIRISRVKPRSGRVTRRYDVKKLQNPEIKAALVAELKLAMTQQTHADIDGHVSKNRSTFKSVNENGAGSVTFSVEEPIQYPDRILTGIHKVRGDTVHPEGHGGGVLRTRSKNEMKATPGGGSKQWLKIEDYRKKFMLPYVICNITKKIRSLNYGSTASSSGIATIPRKCDNAGDRVSKTTPNYCCIMPQQNEVAERTDSRFDSVCQQFT
ncbi:hypothetical protein ILUMI_08475 [Ignelater luminosus]|uniref:Uncharacterized protein n=1 Tax=Ignelater luminosus TaxID=2038154 RepID=A0A8K0DB77_IGNLU|nr:hypothetical protein ILUMI_08475 [Ignelater luminosus]